MRFDVLAAVAFATSTLAVPVSEPEEKRGQAEWDVIVVGAGPAGTIVATKMAEAGKKTLLLEQGGPSYGVTGSTERPNWLSGTKLSRVDVPGLYPSIFSVSSPMVCDTNSQVNAFQACTIGGNSAINAGLFFQPPKSDFDNYFPHDWKSEDMQSAINKLKKRQPAAPATQSLQGGYDEAHKWLVKGAGFKEINYEKDPDDKSKVFGHAVYDYIKGQRGGPVVTYLQDALKLKNFQMQSNTKVLRIARNGDKATGVVVNHNGQQSTINLSPKGRVIVSGGALQSPALLMHSGIGDPSTLNQMHSAGALSGNPSTWINNTAVGDRLFDNPNTFIELQSNKVNAYAYSYQDPDQTDAQRYLQKRKGPYSFGTQTTTFWDQVNHPGHGGAATMQGTLGVSGYGQYTDAHTITLQVYGTSGMLSTGKVVLDSSKNFRPGPSGSFYYSNPADAQAIATFIQRIFKALKHSSFESLNLDENSTHDQIVNYITSPSQYAKTQVNHWSSSCRFGDCVDVDTVVKGTQNIHVVDASILPPLSVNPQMGVMIAAERASERILAL